MDKCTLLLKYLQSYNNYFGIYRPWGWLEPYTEKEFNSSCILTEKGRGG